MDRLEKNQALLTWYDSSQHGWIAISELKELFRYRYLIVQLVKRDILTRYKRSVLGVAWTMLNPLGMMVVLTIAFSQIFRFDLPNYPAYVLSGLIFWNFFTQTTTMTMQSTVWGGGLFRRIYIPRAIFAISSMGTGIVNLFFALIPFVLILIVTGHPIPWTFVLAPIPIVLLVMFSLGLGLIISTIAIYFPDVGEMYLIGLTAWMYLTPVIYPAAMLPDRIKFWLELFNPMFPLVHLFRLVVYEGTLPGVRDVIGPLVLSSILLVTGWIMFAKKSDEFAYRV